MFGKYTSNHYNGSSVIDLLTTYTSFENISHFKIGNYIPWLSDHTPIFSNFNISVNKKAKEIPINLNEREQGYIWNDNFKKEFQAFLSNAKETLEAANKSTKYNSDPNNLVEEIKHVILEACKQTNFKKRKTTKTTKKTIGLTRNALI